MAYVFLWNAWNRVQPLLGRSAPDLLKPERDLLRPDSGGYLESGYRVSAKLLREFGDLAAARGMPLLVVLIPAEFQVYPHRLQAGWSDGKEALDVALPNRRWAQLAKEAKLPVLDLLPVFRGHASGAYLYMSLDGHLTVEGNRLAGETIARAFLPQLAGGRKVGDSQ
jgi:hypothetical protein